MDGPLLEQPMIGVPLISIVTLHLILDHFHCVWPICYYCLSSLLPHYWSNYQKLLLPQYCSLQHPSVPNFELVAL